MTRIRSRGPVPGKRYGASGASVPESLVQGVCEFLERHGFPPAVEEVLIEEKTAFGLPRELQD